MTQGNDTLHFYYDASNRPAMVEYNGVKYTYIYNLQSDVVAILNSDGTAVVKYRYDAWGKPISKTGDLASTLGTIQPFRYRSYVYDEETGLYYLRSRYYNSDFCRFIISNCKPDQSSGFAAYNLYCYCANCPICSSDPTGYDMWSYAWDSFCAVWITPWKTRCDAMLEDPSLYNIGNWLTCGSFDTIKGAIAPEQPLSLQHWIDSAIVVSWVFPVVAKGAYRPSPTNQLHHTSTSLAQVGKPDVYPNPLSDVKYTDKVRAQMFGNDFHNFPSQLDDMVQSADVFWGKGGDGNLHKYIRLPGSATVSSGTTVKTYEGIYEWVIDIPNVCNHRFFNTRIK